jgi:enoyl-CoA hydratase
MTTTFSTLHLDIGDPIAHIRLARPDLLNRFDGPAHVEFADALDIVARDERVRVLLLSAEGKVFSAGGDFDEIIEARDSIAVRDRITRDARRVFRTLVSLPFPVIAAVQGSAIGMGATLITLCDIVVAYEEAKIADTHVAIGLVAGDGGIVGWSQSIGLLRAKRHLLTGERLTARDAHAMGLVTDLVASPEQAEVRAREIGSQIAALPRAGVEGTKRAFMRLTEQVAQAVFDIGLAYEMESIARPEVAEILTKMRK